MLDISRLLPGEGKFFRLIGRLYAETAAAARHLDTFASIEDAATRARATDDMARCRQNAKAAFTEIGHELCLTFITPFDRDDIQMLSVCLYRICKTIDKVRAHAELHKIGIGAGEAGQVRLIVRASEAMGRVIENLTTGKSPERVIAETTQFDALEAEGDDLRAALLVRLVAEEKNAGALILKKDLLDMLESIIDKYRDAAVIALQIALKHS
jgi:uncharacterized protein Yka (UPF0111/DUF47 family)